jgi:DNA-binding transcriptional LysR family regulator
MADPSLHGMRAFRAVVELQSFKKAGVRLGLGGSAVSKLVAALEKELGALLLQRTTRSIALTDAGSAFYDSAVRVLDETDAAVERLREHAAQPRGQLRVSVPTSFALRWLSPRLPDFLVRYPDLRLDLALDDRFVDIAAEGYDCALRIGSDLPDSALVVRRLGSVARLLVAAPRYLKRAPPLRSPMDLPAHEALLYTLSRMGRHWPFRINGRLVQVAVSGRLTVDNSVMLRETLLAGVGIAQTPDFVVQDLLDSGKLVELLPAYKPPSVGVHGVTTQRKHVPLKTRLFLDFVEAALQGRTST